MHAMQPNNYVKESRSCSKIAAEDAACCERSGSPAACSVSCHVGRARVAPRRQYELQQLGSVLTGLGSSVKHRLVRAEAGAAPGRGGARLSGTLHLVPAVKTVKSAAAAAGAVNRRCTPLLYIFTLRVDVQAYVIYP